MNRYLVTICFRDTNDQFHAEHMIVDQVDGHYAKAFGWCKVVQKYGNCEFVSWKAVRK